MSSPTVRTGMQTDRLGTTFWEWQSGHSLLWGGEGVAPFWRSWCVGWDLRVSEGRWTQAERRAHTRVWSPVGRVLWLWVGCEAWLYKGPEHVGLGDLSPGWVAAHLLHQEFWGRSQWGYSQSGGLLEEEVSGCFWHFLGLLEQDPKLHLFLGWVFFKSYCDGEGVKGWEERSQKLGSSHLNYLLKRTCFPSWLGAAVSENCWELAPGCS